MMLLSNFNNSFARIKPKTQFFSFISGDTVGLPFNRNFSISLKNPENECAQEWVLGRSSGATAALYKMNPSLLILVYAQKMLLSHSEPEIYSEMLYFIGLSLVESTRIKTSMDTKSVGMAKGMKLIFSLKLVICFTFNKRIIAPLIIIELFLIGV